MNNQLLSSAGLEGDQVTKITASSDEPAVVSGAAGTTLCDTCNGINIKDFFLDRPDRHGHRPQKDTQTPPLERKLGFLSDMIKKADCAFCRLVVQALEQSWTEMPTLFNTGLFGAYEERSEVVLQSCEATTSETPARSVEIYVLGRGGRRLVRVGPGGAEVKFRAELRLLADDAPVLGLSELGHGRSISSVCDSELVATWYTKCKQVIQKIAQGSGLSMRIRLIAEKWMRC